MARCTSKVKPEPNFPYWALGLALLWATGALLIWWGWLHALEHLSLGYLEAPL